MTRRVASATVAHTVSWGALLDPRHALAVVGVVLCTLSPAFASFVTATVLPSVVAEIGGVAPLRVGLHRLWGRVDPR